MLINVFNRDGVLEKYRETIYKHTNQKSPHYK